MTAKIDCCLPVKNTHGSLKPVTVHNSHDLCTGGAGVRLTRLWLAKDDTKEGLQADRAHDSGVCWPGQVGPRRQRGSSQEPLNISMS